MKRSGFKPVNYLERGKGKILFGYKDPGTRIPMFAGYSKTGKISWVKKISASREVKSGEIDFMDLVGTYIIAVYQEKVGKETMTFLVAFNIANGDEIWRLMVPGTKTSDTDIMLVTDSRIYLTQWIGLNIVELKTGRHIKRMGR